MNISASLKVRNFQSSLAFTDNLYGFSGKGKSPDGFDEKLIVLQEEAQKNGLDNLVVKVIAHVIRRNELREFYFYLLIIFNL